MTDPYFGFGGEGTAGFGDLDNPLVGGKFYSLGSGVDHVERGVNRLPVQFSKSENLKKLLAIFLSEIQEIEQTIYQMVKQKSLEYAMGKQLDMIGEDVGLPRNGLLNDDIYRNRIAAKIAANASEGTTNDVLKVWSLLLDSDDVLLFEEYPAGIILYTASPIDDFGILEIVKDSIPVTVKLSALIGKDPDKLPFSFLGGPGAGFGSLYDTSVGGQFVSRYET